jgi:hypothetical protein
MAGVDPEAGGFGGREPPCSRTPTFFFNKLVNYGKKIHTAYSMEAIYLRLNLRSQNNSASCQTSTCLI